MPNVQNRIPSSPKTVTTKYQKFKGADFSTDPSQISDGRSPMPLNLIADAGGYPEKRPGWETVLNIGDQINGVFKITVNGTTRHIVHAGDKIYEWDPETATTTVLFSSANNEKSDAVVLYEKLWILTGKEYLVYGEFSGTWQIKNVGTIAYVPTMFIGRDPSGGGDRYEYVNLIGDKRKDSFKGDGSSTAYQLSTTGLNATTVTAEIISGGVSTYITEGSGLSVNRTTGIVTFNSPPASSATEDNVIIEYGKTASGYANRINKCTILEVFGTGTPERIFFTGNPDYPNEDWSSAYQDPTYIADINYYLVGSEETAIMGYLKIQDYLAVIKEDNQQDATVFVRSPTINNNGETVFTTIQGVQNIGAVSKYCFKSFRDDPVFLSRSGVCAIATVTVTLEKTVRRRSLLVDAKLSKEDNLEDAVAAVWKDWYIVCVNNHCYVADANQKSYETRLTDNFVYEWYYWDNIPASVFMEDSDTLYFGTLDGRICRFKPTVNMQCYSDDGDPITAYWETKLDDDGDFMSYKTMIRRGSGLLMKPYLSSSVKVYARTEKDFGRHIRSAGMSIFDFNNIDFSNFSFNTLDTPQVVPFNKKIKKYKMLQISVVNDGLNQGFGVFGIIKRFRIGNYVK